MSSAAVTLPPSLQDSKTVPVPAHLIPLPDSRPSTPEPKVLLPDQSSSGALLPRNSGSNAKGTPNIMQDSGKKVALAESAFSFPPNIRLIIEPRSLSRPPPLLIQAGDAVVDERARKAFCASIHRPIVPLRSYIMPTPASFGESRETLEARRAELKRADYSYRGIEGDIGHYRTNPETGVWEIQVIAGQPTTLKNFPTDVIRVCHEEQGPKNRVLIKVVSFVVHRQVLAAFFAHFGPKLESSATIFRPNGYSTAMVRYQWLPVFAVLNGRPAVYEFLLDYVYEQNPKTVLRSLLGDRVFSQVSPCIEEIYLGTPRTISALPIAERRAAVQLQEEHSVDDIVRVVIYLDEIFDLADELGLESPPFWNVLACVRRIVRDAGAISSSRRLKVAADAHAASLRLPRP